MSEEEGAHSVLLDRGLETLRGLLGDGWDIGPMSVTSSSPKNMPELLPRQESRQTARVSNRVAGTQSTMLVEVVEGASPLSIRRTVEPRLQLMREILGDAAVLVVAEWLSPRSRQTLEELEYGYLDMTGNLRVRLPRSGVFLQATGANHDPRPSRSPWRQGLRGAKAGRLVRVLADVVPPHQGGQLARATELSPSYVSRVLGEQGLVRRQG
jgi:hypothetical protein